MSDAAQKETGGLKDSATQKDLVGSVFGRWTVKRRLGEGPMGPVYEAVSTGRTSAALHVVRPELVAGPDRLERFRRDARLFQKVEHPNIPRLVDVEEVGGRFYLAFELIEGRSLQYRIDQKQPLSPIDARLLASDLLSALATLHERGIVHGDVKPGNVLCGAEGVFRLTAVSLVPRETVTEAATIAEGVMAGGHVRGTPLYMSPEQCQGQGSSPAGDLYSAGATLFAGMTGEPPFMRGSVTAIMDAHIKDPQPDLAAKAPAIEVDLVRLVGNLLAKAPARRPKDARAALAAIVQPAELRTKTRKMLRELIDAAPADAGAAAAPAATVVPQVTSETRTPSARLAAQLPPTAEAEARAPEPEGLSGVARASLGVSLWWNKTTRNPRGAARALSRLGRAAEAGELFLDGGEPVLAAEEFLKAGIPHAAAIVFERIGDAPRAIDAFIAAGKPEDAVRIATLAGKHEEAALAFERVGRLDLALQAYGRAGKPAGAGAILERLGRFGEAAEQLELANEPARAAELYEKASRFADAARLFERLGDLARVAAIWESAGKRSDAARWRAEHELSSGRPLNAAKEFEQAGLLARAADLFVAENQLADAIRCAEAQGDVARAASLCVRAGDMRRAASLYSRAGQHREAARRYHELGDTTAEAMALARAGEPVAAAEVWLAANQPDEARRVLASVEKGKPQRKRARARLGELEARAGRQREAADAFVEALEGEAPTAENVASFVECSDALAACGDLDGALEKLKPLHGLPFAPATLHLRVAELEEKRSLAKSALTMRTPVSGQDLVGVELDRYRANFYVGEGELAWAFEGEHTLLKRPSALRVLKPGLSDAAQKGFLAEARAIAMAGHPNLVDVYDCGQTPTGLHYVAVELTADPTLRQLLKQADGPLPIARACALADGLLAGIAAAHAAGVIHGALKPENILVAQGDLARLVNFPFERHGATTARPTDRWVDHFAFAVIFYEMLAGAVPGSPPRPLAKAMPDLPADLSGAVMKALGARPDEREAALTALREAISRRANVAVGV